METTMEELINKMLEQTDGMWCECEEEEMSDTYFVDDNVHPEIEKHHWRCNKCHKITQIG